MDDKELYERLYRYAKKEAFKNEQTLILPEIAFVKTSLQHPCCLDKSSIATLSGEEYIYTAFWSIFNRVPTKTDLAFWLSKEKKLGCEVFQRKLCKRLSRRIEAKIKNAGYTENYFSGLETIPYTGGRISPDSCMGKFYFYFYLPFFHRIFTVLYGVYGKTFRPIRQWIRRKKYK